MSRAFGFKFLVDALVFLFMLNSLPIKKKNVSSLESIFS